MYKNLVLLAIAMVPITAHAAIIETTTTTSTVTYSLGDNGPNGSFTFDPSASNVFQFATADNTPGHPSQLNVSLVSTAENGGFAFEHNLYVQGHASVALDTVVTVSITNTGSDAVSLRLDSLIDPGHLAVVGDNVGPLNTFFQFTVAQDGTELYTANNNALAGFVAPQNVPFDGLSQYFDPNAPRPASIDDWSATPLNIDLATIAANTTSLITYHTHTAAADDFIYNGGEDSPCADLASCHGVQVAFGDPTSKGGIVGLAMLANSDFTANTMASASPMIGMQFNPYFVPISIVDQGSPLPPAPPLLPAPHYDAPAGVPEPTTWALMLGGFGAIGSTLRRRKTALG